MGVTIGDIVGEYYTVPGLQEHGFLLQDGDFTTIDVPGAVSTEPYGINNKGEIVGSYFAAGTTHGFLLDKKGNFTTIDVPTALSRRVRGINDRGDIVGGYTTAGGVMHGFFFGK